MNIRTPIIIAFASMTLLLAFLSVQANEIMQFELKRNEVKDAWLGKYQEGQYIVEVQLNEQSSKFFSRLTGNNIGKRLAITFEGKVLLRPVIKDRIDSGFIQIRGWASEEDAKRFVQALLPVKQETE